MEFNVITKRPNANKGSMYDPQVEAAQEMEMDQELAIKKNGKENLRHTIYQLIHRKELALKVSEDKDTVYIQRTDTYVPKKIRV